MSTGQKVRLTDDEIKQFEELGYVKGFRIYGDAEVIELQAQYAKMSTMVPADTHISRVNWWHKRNNFIYERVCTHPRILDYVESILGPSFYLWGSHYFVKNPGDGSVVPWHQDAKYWPLTPMQAVTVFVAFGDCDAENACMRVIPGTHREDSLKSHDDASDQSNYILGQEIPAAEIDESQAHDIDLKAGEVSLHTDALIHGSGPNLSDRLRIGFTMRYSPTEVKCDLDVWPTFAAFLVRGVDEYQHNPPGVVPTEFGAPDCMRPA